MRLLTFEQTAATLACSIAHVRNLARAAELADAPIDTIPVQYRRYLDARFPKPIYLGSRRMGRINEVKLREWLNDQD